MGRPGLPYSSYGFGGSAVKILMRFQILHRFFQSRNRLCFQNTPRISGVRQRKPLLEVYFPIPEGEMIAPALLIAFRDAVMDVEMSQLVEVLHNKRNVRFSNRP